VHDGSKKQATRRDSTSEWIFLRCEGNVLDSPGNQNGKIVAFSLCEKPIVGRIVYKGIKSIAESDFASAFNKEKVGLSVGTWFDQNELAHGAAVIKELLAARGCPLLP
jgi:outer membrane protein assembly factor BamA